MTLTPRIRPKELRSRTFVERLGEKNLHVIVGGYGGKPFEMFAHFGKSGDDMRAMCEGLTRMVTLALGVGVEPKHIIKQLRGIKGATQGFDGKGSRNLSIPDVLARVLTEVTNEADSD